MSKTGRYENGKAVMELYEDGRIWLQVGIAGMYADHEEFANLYEIMQSYVEEVENG